MLEVLLASCAPGALSQDPDTAERVRQALRAGEDVGEIMLCLPGTTDAIAALHFARAAADWWDHKLVVHADVIATLTG
jgi:hypothetical protein